MQFLYFVVFLLFARGASGQKLAVGPYEFSKNASLKTFIIGVYIEFCVLLHKFAINKNKCIVTASQPKAFRAPEGL